MKRYEDWELLLHNFVEARVGEPFTWGANDCALFVCDGVAAMTGSDMAAEFRGQYTDEATAQAAMQRIAGGATIEDVAVYVTHKEGLAELPNVRFAQRGDIVLFDSAIGPALGLVYLDGVHAVFVGEAGLRKMAVLDCRRAWRVG